MSSEPTPVEPCKGWVSSCTFCNKRFSDWTPFSDDDDVLSGIPVKSNAFMFALEGKQGKEVVIIGSNSKNMQHSIEQKLNILRKHVSQRKAKETKSNILLRWSNLEGTETKDACAVFAHWHNYGILPRLTTEWPGLNTLDKHFEFSTANGKWCHATKETVWKKPKSKLGPKAIKKCKWDDTCSFCDSRFTSWIPVSEAIEKKLAPSSKGFVMYATKQGRKHNVFYVGTCPSLESEVKYNPISYSKRKETLGDYDYAVVRWMPHDNLEDVDSCFIYAHWANARELPVLNKDWKKSIGKEYEKLLEENNKFTFRTNDLQWCYASDSSDKPYRYNKTKEKRMLKQSIEQELLEDM